MINQAASDIYKGTHGFKYSTKATRKVGATPFYNFARRLPAIMVSAAVLIGTASTCRKIISGSTMMTMMHVGRTIPSHGKVLAYYTD
jgi:hypothetical protein